MVGQHSDRCIRPFHVALLFLVLGTMQADATSTSQPQIECVHASFHACGIKTNEDAENLEIARSMRAGDQT